MPKALSSIHFLDSGNISVIGTEIPTNDLNETIQALKDLENYAQFP